MQQLDVGIHEQTDWLEGDTQVDRAGRVVADPNYHIC
jgi:hypothetical protein